MKIKELSSKAIDTISSKDIPVEEVIEKSIQIPGVKVDRKEFLAKQFSHTQTDKLKEIIDLGPVECGISRQELETMANKLIITRTSQSSVASFVAGIPGGFAMAAAVPADVMQFFGMALRLAQELSYLYGAKDLFNEGVIDSEGVKNHLLLYCGTMFGVSGAMNGVRVLSTQIAKTTLKKLPQKALTKTFWYPIVKQIAKALGYSITKQTTAKAISNVIPVAGGVISGTLNFVTMKPMAKRLSEAFDKSIFEYSEDEYEDDLRILSQIEDGEYDVEYESNDVLDKISSGIKKVIRSKKENETEINNSDNSKEKTVDPIEEIKKYKELLDLEIISKEEFDKKKASLLNL